jgi:hypothetical protein
VEEIKDRVHERADWRHYAVAHPVASLVVAAAGGLILARVMVPAVRLVGLPLLLLPRIARRAPPPSGLAAILARLSTAGQLASQAAFLPALVSHLGHAIGRVAGRRRR